jgi:hypothetical protein
MPAFLRSILCLFGLAKKYAPAAKVVYDVAKPVVEDILDDVKAKPKAPAKPPARKAKP